MKKQAIKLNTAFSFDKETIAKLSDAQMSAVADGKGEANNTGGSCNMCSCNQGSLSGIF